MRWRSFADRTLSAHIQLLVEPAGEDALLQAIKDSNVATQQGVNGSSHFAIIANLRLSGQSGMQNLAANRYCFSSSWYHHDHQHYLLPTTP